MVRTIPKSKLPNVSRGLALQADPSYDYSLRTVSRPSTRVPVFTGFPGCLQEAMPAQAQGQGQLA